MGTPARLAFVFASAFTVFVCGPPLTRAASPPEVVGSPPPPSSADVTVDATIHASSVRYDIVNGKRILHVIGPANCGGYRVERTNIPVRPKPGVTYRNVTIHAYLAARMDDRGRLASARCSAVRPKPTPMHFK